MESLERYLYENLMAKKQQFPGTKNSSFFFPMKDFIWLLTLHSSCTCTTKNKEEKEEKTVNEEYTTVYRYQNHYQSSQG